jgi:hypothetical protein
MHVCNFREAASRPPFFYLPQRQEQDKMQAREDERFLDVVNNTEWERVTIVSGMVHADIIRGRLETEGIPVRLLYESAGRIYALTLDGLGEVEIRVPSACLRRAREVLGDVFGEEDIPWDKPRHREP